MDSTPNTYISLYIYVKKKNIHYNDFGVTNFAERNIHININCQDKVCLILSFCSPIKLFKFFNKKNEKQRIKASGLLNNHSQDFVFHTSLRLLVIRQQVNFTIFLPNPSVLSKEKAQRALCNQGLQRCSYADVGSQKAGLEINGVSVGPLIHAWLSHI